MTLIEHDDICTTLFAHYHRRLTWAPSTLRAKRLLWGYLWNLFAEHWWGSATTKWPKQAQLYVFKSTRERKLRKIQNKSLDTSRYKHIKADELTKINPLFQLPQFAHKNEEKITLPEMQDQAYFLQIMSAQMLNDPRPGAVAIYPISTSFMFLLESKYPLEMLGCKITHLVQHRAFWTWMDNSVKWGSIWKRLSASPKRLKPCWHSCVYFNSRLKKIFLTGVSFNHLPLSKNRIQACPYQFLKKTNFGRKN